MDNTFNMWLSIIVISIFGTLAHFLYGWTHNNRVVGLFTAVNESTWEHIKIAITGTLLWSIYDGYIYGLNPNYFCAKLVSLFVLALFIPAVFYSYKKLLKRSVLFIDITIFYAAIILSQSLFYFIIELPPMFYIFQYLSFLGFLAFFGAYMTLTLAPLRTFLFKDPITGKYGFPVKRHLRKIIKRRKKSQN